MYCDNTMLVSCIESYGGRRGAAFGLSAVVKGMGIPALKQHDIVNRLKEACSGGSFFSSLHYFRNRCSVSFL